MPKLISPTSYSAAPRAELHPVSPEKPPSDEGGGKTAGFDGGRDQKPYRKVVLYQGAFLSSQLPALTALPRGEVTERSEAGEEVAF